MPWTQAYHPQSVGFWEVLLLGDNSAQKEEGQQRPGALWELKAFSSEEGQYSENTYGGVL